MLEEEKFKYSCKYDLTKWMNENTPIYYADCWSTDELLHDLHSRYIGLMANVTIDAGVRANSRKQETSKLAKSMFSQVDHPISDQSIWKNKTSEQWSYIFLRGSYSKTSEFPFVFFTKSVSTCPSAYEIWFQLKKSEARKLYELFIADFTLFGYDPEEFINSASPD